MTKSMWRAPEGLRYTIKALSLYTICKRENPNS